MRSLAAAYAVLALLTMPALLWAADDPPTAATPATAPATTPAPAPETAPQESASETTRQAPAPPPAPEPAPGPQAAAKAAPAEDVVAQEATAEPPVARTAVSGGVTIEDFKFSPATITVDEGDTVTWTNRDGVGHTATADDGSFDTGILSRDESGSQTFDEAGSFPYHCTPHPNMTGTVVVRASGGGDSGGGDTDTAGSTSGTAGTGTGSSSGSGSTLPATGLQVGILALGGVLLVGGGALLRRRTG